MKRVIRASQFPYDWEKVYQVYKKPGRSTYRFSGSESDSRGVLIGSISKLAPYDDADYVWAKIEGNGLVKFIKSGKIIDKMQTHNYLDFEEDYEQVWEYFDQIINDIIDELEELNNKIEPRIIHN